MQMVLFASEQDLVVSAIALQGKPTKVLIHIIGCVKMFPITGLHWYW